MFFTALLFDYDIAATTTRQGKSNTLRATDVQRRVDEYGAGVNLGEGHSCILVRARLSVHKLEMKQDLESLQK